MAPLEKAVGAQAHTWYSIYHAAGFFVSVSSQTVKPARGAQEASGARAAARCARTKPAEADRIPSS